VLPPKSPVGADFNPYLQSKGLDPLPLRDLALCRSRSCFRRLFKWSLVTYRNLSLPVQSDGEFGAPTSVVPVSV
jgi:hypothetical protein